MKRRVVMLVTLALLGAFFLATAATIAVADPPGCKSCRKTDCPKGPCYFDCVSCCFIQNHVVYCYK